MKVNFLKERALRELKSQIKDNLDLYRKDGFALRFADPFYWFASEVELDESALKKMKLPDEQKNLFEVENCIAVYSALKGLTPSEATEERLWAYITHTVLLDYARARWPIPSDDTKAVKHIAAHFFASDQRGLERDNAVSRLWWMSHLCSRVQKLKLEESLKILLHKSDVRQQVVERPTTSQSVEVFSAIIRILGKSYHTPEQKLFERETWRRFMVRLNGLGGYRLLDALDAAAVEGIFAHLLSEAKS
jgi:hypothetical protein